MRVDYDKDQLAYALANALKERDEAREDLEHWKIEYEIVVSRLCGIKHERDNGIIAENEIIPVLRKERDEARRKLNDLDVTAIHSCHNECQRPICVLRRERDEAREEANKLSGAYEDATNYYARIIELKEELDEAREALVKILKNE